MRHISILAVSFALILSSCGSSRKSKNTQAPNDVVGTQIDSSKVVVDDTEIDTANADKPLENKVLVSKWIPTSEFKTLQYKAKCQYKKDGKNLPFTAYIRMVKGEKIWISVMGGGILEVARALITPDSVQAIDKLNKVAYVHDVAYLKSLIGVQVDFQTLEAILSSQLMDTIEATVLSDETQAVVLQQDLSEDIQALLTLDRTNNVWSELTINFENMDVLSAHVLFNFYEMIAPETSVSMKRNITIVQKKGNSTLDMELSKVVLDQNPSMNFSIPEGYTYK